MKKLILSLFIPLVFACSDDSGDDCNPIPDLETFDASSITENSAILNGSIYTPDCVESVTSQGFVYSTESFPVYETDNYIEVSGSEISAILEGLEFSTTYYYRTYFNNLNGTYYGDVVSFTTAEQELTYVPDDNFEELLILYELDDVMDDYVITANLNELEIIYFNNVSDFTGLEALVSLKEIHLAPCINIFYEGLDNGNVYYENFDTSNLEYLELVSIVNSCNNSSATPTFEILDFTSNINLKEITVESGFADSGYSLVYTQSNLDLSNNINLEKINGCFYTTENDLFDLDLSNIINLKILKITSCNIEELDLSSNTNLNTLMLEYLNLPNLDLSNNINLTVLNIFSSTVSELNLNNNDLLEVLYIPYNQGISELDLSGNTSLKLLYMLGTQLESSLDLSNNIDLEQITISPQNPNTLGFMTEIDVSNMPNLNFLDISQNQITNINLSNNPLLTQVYLNNNQLSSLDVSNCSSENFFLNALNNNFSCITASQDQIDNSQFYVDSNVQILTNCD